MTTRKERITAAARALCKIASEECNVDEQDNWKTYSDLFIADATTAIKAADSVGTKAPRKLKKRDTALIEKQRKQIAQLEETVVFYRTTYGIIGSRYA